MFALLFLAMVLAYAVVVILTSIIPARSHYSFYERKRRQKRGNNSIDELDLQREDTIEIVVGIFRTLSSLMLVIFAVFAILAFGWFGGSLIALTGVVFYIAIARFEPIHEASQRIYDRLEVPLLGLIVGNITPFRLFRNVQNGVEGEVYIASKEELLHVVDHLPMILSKEERIMIKSGLAFSSIKVSTILTPRSVLETVNKNDLIGPLLLDELHKTGHSRFPVVDSDIDHVVGVLYIYNLLQLSDKKTYRAEDLMSKPVHYINQDQTLDQALAAFLQSHHHMFVVVNEYRETVGVLTLEDTIGSLLGRKVVDEFGAHDDLSSVAARNPRGRDSKSAS